MFKKTRASSSTMSEVEIRPVTDELTAMRRKLPEGYDEYKIYATEMTAMQSIPSVMGRRQFHALLLDGNFRPDRALPVRTKSSEMALRMLIGSADIAIGLLPAGAPIDARIKAEAAHDLTALVGLATDGHRVFEQRLLATYDLSHAEKQAYPPRLWPYQQVYLEIDYHSGFSSVAGVPAIHGFQQPRSLAAFIEARPNLEHLVDQAVVEFGKAEVWRLMSRIPGSLDHAILDRAAHCAKLRGYSALATVGIWPARSESDRQIKIKAQAIARHRSNDEPKFRAAVDLAHLHGEVLAG